MEKSSEKFKKNLIKLNLDSEIIFFEDSTKTSLQAANCLRIDVSQIGKSIIFKTETGKFILVISSGANRINEKKIEIEVKEKLIKTNGEEIKSYTGYPIGGIPPFGHDNPLQVFLDKNLLNFERIFCAAGTPNSVFEINPKKIAEITNAKILDIL